MHASVIFSCPACIRLRNIWTGQRRRQGKKGNRNVPVVNLFFHPLWIRHSPKLFIVSPKESKGAKKEVKRRKKYALGEISLLVILHAADTETITNTQRPNYTFRKEEERQNCDIRVMKENFANEKKRDRVYFYAGFGDRQKSIFQEQWKTQKRTFKLQLNPCFGKKKNEKRKIIQALREGELAFIWRREKRGKKSTRRGKTKSKEGSKGCHQRDILLLNNTNKQHTELRNTGTNRSIVHPPTECWARKMINEWGNIIKAHYATHSLPWLHYIVIINVWVGVWYEKDVIIAMLSMCICVAYACTHAGLCLCAFACDAAHRSLWHWRVFFLLIRQVKCYSILGFARLNASWHLDNGLFINTCANHWQSKWKLN